MEEMKDGEGTLNDMITVSLKMINKENLSLTIPRDILVSDLKLEIEGHTEIEPSRQRLIYAGKVLKDTSRISEYNVEHGKTIHMVCRRSDQQPTSSSSSSESTSTTTINTSTYSSSTSSTDGPTASLHNLGNGVMMGQINIEDGNLENINEIIGNVLQGFGISMDNNGSPSNVTVISSDASTDTTHASPSITTAVDVTIDASPTTTMNTSTTSTNPSSLATRNISSNFPMSSASSNSLNYISRHSRTVQGQLRNIEVPSIIAPSPTGTEETIARATSSLSDTLQSVDAHLRRIASFLHTSTALSDDARMDVQDYIHGVAPRLIQVGTICSELGNTLLNFELGESSQDAMLPTFASNGSSRSPESTDHSGADSSFLPSNDPTITTTSSHETSQNSSNSGNNNTNPSNQLNGLAQMMGNIISNATSRAMESAISSNDRSNGQGTVNVIPNVRVGNGQDATIIATVSSSPMAIPMRTTTSQSSQQQPANHDIVPKYIKRLLNQMFEQLDKFGSIAEIFQDAIKTRSIFLEISKCFQNLYKEEFGIINFDENETEHDEQLEKWIQILVDELNIVLVNEEAKQSLSGDKKMFSIETLKPILKIISKTLLTDSSKLNREEMCDLDSKIINSLHNFLSSWIDSLHKSVFGGNSVLRNAIHCVLKEICKHGEDTASNMKQEFETIVLSVVEDYI